MTAQAIRLLLLEDNAGDRRLVQAKLSDAAPRRFVITQVERLADAIERLSIETFDVILSDLTLPDSDRLTTVHALVAHSPTLPLVVLTGSNDDSIGDHAIVQGAQDYLLKSDASGALIARSLRYAMERKRFELELRKSNAALDAQVTERTAALASSLDQLQASLASAHALAETASDAIVTSDEGRTILSWNHAAETMFGFTAAQALGQNLTLIIPLRYRDPHTAGMTKVLAGGAGCVIGKTVELIGLNKAGLEFPMELSLSTWSGPQGKMFAAIMRDVTQRKRAEDALRKSEERWQFAIEGAGDGLWDWNIQTGEAFYSLRYKEMLGFADNEFGSSSEEWTQRIHAEDAPGVIAALQPYLDGKPGSAVVEFRMLRKDGLWQWTLGRGVVVQRDADGKPSRMIGTNSDITKRKQAEEALRQSETRYRTMFDNAPEGVWMIGPDRSTAEVNQRMCDLVGYKREELLGRNPVELVDEENSRIFEEKARIVPNHQTRTYEIALRHRDGHNIRTEFRATNLFNEDGSVMGVLAFVVDLTERKQAEGKLQLAANVFSHAREGIIITDVEGTIIDINEAFTRITGYDREVALGQNPRILKSDRQDRVFYEAMWRGLTEQGHWSGEIWNRRKDGKVYAELLTISSVRDAGGVVRQYVGLFSDITAIKEHQYQLEHIAHFDALTNLPNRLLLADRLQQAMAQALRRGQQLAVVYLDLDGFKTINDQHGHQIGDQFLIALAQRMKQALREGDSLARLGGDEFVAVLIDLEDQAACRPLLTRLLAACAQSAHVGDLSLQASASLGVTFYPQARDIDADQLLRQADQAMYQAKVAGKNRYHFFDAEQDNSVRGYHESVERIRLALDKREFVLHYQPKVNMRTGQIIGAEALIRWQHPEKGQLAPALFLPLIEDHALAVSIGEWVLDTALTQMQIWQAAGLEFGVSVNIGARQLQQSDFVERLRAILDVHPGVKAGDLELEVLETSALIDIAQVSQVIEACAQIGVTFALDDFGTGYSSLTYLKRLRVAMLKIDQSFVRDMLEDKDDLTILEGIIGLAASFKRQVIAEGVETVAHGSLLLLLGCELAQGFVIARPMPAEQLPFWAAEWQTDPASGDEMRNQQPGKYFGPWTRR